MNIYSGMSLRQALKVCRYLGVRFECLRGTGELKIWFKDRLMRINGRRKDAPLALVVRLKQLNVGVGSSVLGY